VADVITAIQRLMQGLSVLLHAKTYTDSQQVAPQFSTDLSVVSQFEIRGTRFRTPF